MRRLYLLVGMLVLLTALGCTRSKPGGPAATDDGPKANTSLLDPLVAKDKLGDAKAVIDVRDNAKDGEEVVLVGTVPPENVRPFNDTLAVVRLMDPRDLADPVVKEEFECEEAAT